MFRRRLARCAALTLHLTLLLGCDSDPAGVDAGPPIPTERCDDVCAETAMRCGAPPAMVGPACANLCSGSATQTQLDCLRASACGALIDAFARSETVCGIGESDAGPPAERDSGPAGRDAGPGGRDAGPGSCVIGDRQCPGDYEVFRCEELAGRPIEVRESCPPTRPCENGWCIDPSRPGLQSTCASASDCRSPARCESTMCCNPVGEVCAENADCCGGASCAMTSFGFRACR